MITPSANCPVNTVAIQMQVLCLGSTTRLALGCGRPHFETDAQEVSGYVFRSPGRAGSVSLVCSAAGGARQKVRRILLAAELSKTLRDQALFSEKTQE
jgi:hypothetical protein